MNFQMTPVSSPVRILIVNPLTPAARMTIVKILLGEVLGRHQLVDMILLVYSNERPAAEIYKMELLTCAFVIMNSISISTDIPNISDADIFVFMSTLKNPNTMDFENIDDEEFDALYLIIKIANSLSLPKTPVDVEEQDDKPEKLKNRIKDILPQKPLRPTILADGLVTISILYNFSHNLPSEIFFCPSSLGAIAKSTLGEILKIRCNELNNALVWAADDEVFHVEIEEPHIVRDYKPTHDNCEWLGASKELLETLKLDHMQFNESWMKKEFIEKVQTLAAKNPYGSIYKAVKYARALKSVWRTRTHKHIKEWRRSMGVISDGSLGTIKGCAYILPLLFVGDSWSVNHSLGESSHVRQEIKRINKRCKEQHSKLMKYCKTFLKDNILNQAFIPKDDETGSQFSMHSSRHTVALYSQ